MLEMMISVFKHIVITHLVWFSYYVNVLDVPYDVESRSEYPAMACNEALAV